MRACSFSRLTGDLQNRLTQTLFLYYRANEVTTLQNKKADVPADVFRALDDIEFGFMRERVEAEFASAQEPPSPKPKNQQTSTTPNRSEEHTSELQSRGLIS